MRIVSIQLFKIVDEKKEPIQIASTYEVGFVGMFYRSSLKQFLNFNSRLIAGYIIYVIIDVLQWKRD
jgi:hypothetical protein